MKKIILSLVVALIVSFGVNAQATFKPGVGVNFSSVSDADDGVKGKAGWQLGGSVAFGEKFYFEPGVFFQKQALVDENTTADDDVATFNGIRVPVAVGLDVLGNNDSLFGLRVFGGGSGFFVTKVSDNLNKDDIETTKWGVFAGAGVDITFIYVDLSYEWSLTNIQKDVSNIDLGKSRGLYLTAGFRF
ncbi:outer membrane beta-barrel protein [Algoriphagus chordae]|uniref:Outer membrane protein with beta-barrel domain n=1 Tax=Algoriphagus chordae TaxID=237019 RepID=A0A2W7QJC4_9BACT|nr:outer membrane beta-barrel protein [Algoriphagus chordae]PZX48443.1 outer membrane protein with beta-barrel domain [Algoriphagus chordae]